MTDPAATQPVVERDERLALLLDELTHQRGRGERPDVAGLAGRHPDLAEELRQLWAAVEFAGAFAQAPADRDGAAAPQTPVPAAGTLPRTFGDYELLEEI